MFLTSLFSFFVCHNHLGGSNCWPWQRRRNGGTEARARDGGTEGRATSANIAKRTRSQGMFSDRNYGKQHPARGTSKLRHVREFCRSDRAKDVLAAFHAYDRRVKPDREKGHPKIHDRNFDKWVSFHFGSVKA